MHFASLLCILLVTHARQAIHTVLLHVLAYLPLPLTSTLMPRNKTLLPFAVGAREVEPSLGLLQVGNQTLEKNVWTRPENDTNLRPAYYVSTYNGSSDLAGQLSAAFAATAMVFRDSDLAYYQKLMNMSTLLYAAGVSRRGSYTFTLDYPCATNTASSNVVQAAKPVCPPGDEMFLGAMVATYNSTSYYDDLTWAAAWLNLATEDPAYLSDAYRSVFCAIVCIPYCT